MSERRTSSFEEKTPYQGFVQWRDMVGRELEDSSVSEKVNQYNKYLLSELVSCAKMLERHNWKQEILANKLARIQYWSEKKYEELIIEENDVPAILQSYVIPHKSVEFEGYSGLFGVAKLTPGEVLMMTRGGFLAKIVLLAAASYVTLGTDAVPHLLNSFGISREGKKEEGPVGEIVGIYQESIREFYGDAYHTAEVVLKNISNRIRNLPAHPELSTPSRVIACAILMTMYDHEKGRFRSKSEFDAYATTMVEEFDSEIFSIENSDLYSWFDEGDVEKVQGLYGEKVGKTNYDYLSISVASASLKHELIPAEVARFIGPLANILLEDLSVESDSDDTNVVPKKNDKPVVHEPRAVDKPAKPERKKPTKKPDSKKDVEKKERRGKVVDKKTLKFDSQKDRAFDSVSSSELVHLEDTYGIETRDTGDYVHESIAPKLKKFYDALHRHGITLYITAARKKSGNPNNYEHHARCHYTGTCVDAKFESKTTLGKDLNAQEIITFCKLAAECGFYVQYENKHPGRKKAKTLKNAGIPIYGYDTMSHAFRHISGEHFSLYSME